MRTDIAVTEQRGGVKDCDGGKFENLRVPISTKVTRT
jgi:hypothetical protein